MVLSMLPRTHLRLLLLGWLLAQSASADEFEPLFNGKDLDGWVNVNCAPSTWSVRDSTIICTGIPTGVLRTDKQYENFILELEWMHLKKGGNAGVFVFSGALPICGQPFTKAVECQVLDGNHGDVFAIQGATFVPDRPHPKGWMRCLPTESRNNPAGQWNHYRIECQDGRVSLAVNGKVVAGGTKCNPRKGYIVLESEGSEVHFKNIRLKELPSTKVPEAEIAELDRGFVSLYSGVDLSGWKGGAHWKASDWNLECRPKADGDNKNLTSEKNFSDYELIVDWKTPAKPAPQEVPVMVAGVVPKAKITREPGQWNRAVITVQGWKMKVAVNDQPAVDAPTGGATPSPIILLHRPEGITFANIYLRPLN
jgi:hypothetical protein